MEERFLPVLRDHVERLSRQFPRVAMRAAGWSVGSATDFEAHCVGIDCLLGDTPLDQPDNVALVISAYHITTNPQLESVDVVWGHPSGAIEAELSDLSHRPYTEGIATSVLDRLPSLIEGLEEALARGHPPEQGLDAFPS
jgi:hypothetical protein